MNFFETIKAKISDFFKHISDALGREAQTAIKDVEGAFHALADRVEAIEKDFEVKLASLELRLKTAEDALFVPAITAAPDVPAATSEADQTTTDPNAAVPGQSGR